MRSRTIAMHSIACLAVTLLICLQIARTAGGQDPARQTPPECLGRFTTHEEADEFLRTARFIKAKRISVGVTGPQKVTLEKDGRQEFGIFKTIDEHKPGITSLPTGPELDFKDSWRFEVGAYELDKLLDLNMIPPTVERSYEQKRGSLQLWIDGCLSEEERSRKKMSPPDRSHWGEQIMKQRIFDCLIYNIDRNAGNILVTPNWEMILIDHSRAFKSSTDLRAPQNLTYFSRSLMEAFGRLDAGNTRERAGKYLTGPEIRAMLQRRDKILALYKKVAENPESVYP